MQRSTKQSKSNFSQKESRKSQCADIGFVYDIPKSEGVTNTDIAELFNSVGFPCTVQVIADDTKPFYTARVKFQNEAQLQLALEQLRYFKINGKTCRLLSYEPLLERNVKSIEMIKDPKFDLSQKLYSQLLTASKSCLSEISQESQALPDNSFVECNLFVKGVDKYLDSSDLYNMFKSYGDVKSAKLSLYPESHQSKGYGFIWFNSEDATQKAIRDSKQGEIPLQCTLYKPRSLQEMMTKPFKSVIIKNFPMDYVEYDLVKMFSSCGEPQFCKVVIPPTFNVSGMAMITFESPEIAMKAVEQHHGRMFQGQSLYVQPAMNQQFFEKLQSFINQQPQKSKDTQKLYLSNIPKSISYEQLRKYFAQYGAIQCLNYSQKEEYDTSVAYLSYKNNLHSLKVLKLKQVDLDGAMIKISSLSKKEDARMTDKENLDNNIQLGQQKMTQIPTTPLIKSNQTSRQALSEVPLNKSQQSSDSNPEEKEDLDKEEIVKRIQAMESKMKSLYETIVKTFEGCELNKYRASLEEYVKLQIEKSELEKSEPILDKEALSKRILTCIQSKSDVIIEEWLVNYQGFDFFVYQQFVRNKSN